MNKLKELRENARLSQDKMAREMGVFMSFYEKVERGHAKPSRAFMEKLKNRFPQANIALAE